MKELKQLKKKYYEEYHEYNKWKRRNPGYQCYLGAMAQREESLRKRIEQLEEEQHAART